MANTTIKQRQIAGGLDGWIPAEQTWTYASADDPTYTFTVAADVTTKYSAGMKIKLTQGTVKYFIITAVSTYSGGKTTITVYGGTDYDLANSAISANAYSMMKSPQGFPMSPAKWDVKVTDASQRTQASPTQNAWYNLGTTACQISVPVGAWYLEYCVLNNPYNSGNVSSIIQYSTLSTANNSESNTEMTVIAQTGGAASTLLTGNYTLGAKTFVEVATKTLYYLNAKTSVSGQSNITFANQITPMVIRATCAYL